MNSPRSHEDDDMDDEIVEEELIYEKNEHERSFNKLAFPEKEQQKKEEQEIEKKEIPYPIETMYIIFSFFKEEIRNIGNKYNCKIKIILNMIKVSSVKKQEEKFQNCIDEIKKFVDKITYMKIENIPDKYKIYDSPYFNKQARKDGFQFTKFDGSIYAFTVKLNSTDFKHKIKNFCYGYTIFQVIFKPLKRKDLAIYAKIRDFIKCMIEQNRSLFQQKRVTVQIGNSKEAIYFIGKGNNQAGCMHSKNTMRNILQSMVVVVYRDEELEEEEGLKRVKKMENYSQKISKYPIKIDLIGNLLTIISKDNILEKLFKKQKFLKELKLTSKNQFGLFVPVKFHSKKKIGVIEEICTKRGYDFSKNQNIYHLFKKVIISDNENTQVEETLELFSEVMDIWKDTKEKYTVYNQINFKRNESDLEFIGEYLSTGQTQKDEVASKILMRDVMSEKVVMCKKSIVQFNSFDGEESEIYWQQDGKKVKKHCEIENLEKGKQYFKGKVKKSGGESVYFIESLVTVI